MQTNGPQSVNSRQYEHYNTKTFLNRTYYFRGQYFKKSILPTPPPEICIDKKESSDIRKFNPSDFN